MESISELISRLIDLKLKSKPYTKEEKSLMREMIVKMDRKLADLETDELKEEIGDLKETVEAMEEDLEDKIKDLDRRLEKVEE
jgi:hypothetical protein